MNTLLQVGIVLTAMDKMSGVLTGAADKAAKGFARLQQRVHQVGQAMTEMGTKASLMGHGILAGLETPIKAFADLDEASTNLRVAMMDNFGQIPSQFAEINRQAVELGNVLKGNTADFTNAATALLENGTSIESITNGGLKAASYLGVILKQVPAQAAEMTAKFREAFGLADNELVKMADLTQRAKFAFGLNPEEIKYAAQYAGATLNNLKLTGIENTRMFLAMQGIARQKGMEGSVFGTNISSMLNNIGMMESKLHRNSKIMREVNADLRRAGIRLQFFDQAGHFVGLEKMVGQLEKLKVLSEKDRLNVINRVFGMEGGRIASMLADAGQAGLQHALGTMQKQADLMQRIKAVNQSAKNTWEALTGTITNFWAAVGGPMVTALYPPMLGDCKDQRSFVMWATLWLSECWRLARPGAPVLVFSDWRQLPAMTDAIQAAGFEWRGIVVWHKPSARPMLGSFRRDCEFVVHAVKTPAQAWSRRCWPGFFHYNVVASEKVHLTGKPLPLLVDLLGIAPDGGMVLDPFIGGGTTPLACVETGRRFIGVELSEAYYKLAGDRINKAEASAARE